MARYRRVRLMEREELSRMLAVGYSLRAIGHALSQAPSTLSRELTRHHATPVTYRAVRAHQPRKLTQLHAWRTYHAEKRRASQVATQPLQLLVFCVKRTPRSSQARLACSSAFVVASGPPEPTLVAGGSFWLVHRNLSEWFN